LKIKNHLLPFQTRIPAHYRRNRCFSFHFLFLALLLTWRRLRKSPDEDRLNRAQLLEFDNTLRRSPKYQCSAYAGACRLYRKNRS